MNNTTVDTETVMWLSVTIASKVIVTENFTSPSTSLQPLGAESLWLQKYGMGLVRHLLIVAVVTGIFGNVMTIVVIKRFSSRGPLPAMDRYYLALAIVDLCVNVTGPVVEWALAVTGQHVRAFNDVTCKLLYYFLNVALCSSEWVLVAMTTQRTLLVLWPHRVQLLCTTRRSSIVISAVVVFFGLFYTHFLYGLALDRKSGVCVPVGGYITFLATIWMKVEFVISSILPIFWLLAANAVLVTKLRKTVNTDELSQSHGEENQKRRKRKANSVTATAILVSMAFVLLNLPLSLMNVLTFTIPTGSLDPPADVLRNFLVVLSIALAYFNSSVNFYLYCLTGTKFRKESVQVLFACFKRRLAS